MVVNDTGLNISPDGQIVKQIGTAENAKMIYIIGIPDYIISAINSKGTDTETFLNKFNDIIVSSNQLEFRETVKAFLEGYLTKYDISDIYSFNSILRDNLNLEEVEVGITYPDIDDNGDKKESTTRLINHYNDNDLDLGSILMSKINNNDKLPFEIKSTENCLFILPKKGFTNFITKNIKIFQFYFLNFIIITLRKLYGEKVAYDSIAFRTFSRLVYTYTR